MRCKSEFSIVCPLTHYIPRGPQSKSWTREGPSSFLVFLSSWQYPWRVLIVFNVDLSIARELISTPAAHATDPELVLSPAVLPGPAVLDPQKPGTGPAGGSGQGGWLDWERKLL